MSSTPPPSSSSSSSLFPLVPNPKISDCTLRDLVVVAILGGHAMREPVTTADVVHAFDVADEVLEARAGVLEGNMEVTEWPTASEIFTHNENGGATGGA